MLISPQSIAERNQIINDHRKLILEIRAIEKEIGQLLKNSDPRWRHLEGERSEKLRGVEPLIEKYWDWIPVLNLSRCPICRTDVLQCFDPVDFNGFWWMDRTQRPCTKGGRCEHFRLLLGAIDLNELPFEKGLFECHPGPDRPYIVPRILEMPTMQAVIGTIPMHCGFSAYPICYFSQTPPGFRSLTQSWAQKQYRFPTGDGKTGWDIVTDEYDFNLSPWQEKEKLFWFRDEKIL